MATVGSKLFSGKLKVEETGKRQQLPALVEGTAISVIVYASSTNEGEVVVGGSNVVAKAGNHTTPERVGISLKKEAYISFDINDPSQIYVDVTVAKDGVSYTALLA
jgi:hypothetical protein